MFEKWNRKYKLTCDIGRVAQSGNLDRVIVERTIIIEYPFTLNISIARNTFSQVNTANLSLLGLGESTRADLYLDQYNKEKVIKITLEAGYDSGMATIFKGTVKQCYSYKASGGTEYQTEIEAWDGGLSIYLGESNKTFTAGVDATETLEGLVNDFPLLEMGGIGDEIKIDKTKRGAAYEGGTYDILRGLCNGNCFIDNEKIYFATQNEVRQGELIELDVTAGLLSTPMRRETLLSLTMMFEPRFVIGQKILLTSLTSPYLNGEYKILGIRHEGVISGAVCRQLTTTVDLFIGTKLFNYIKEY